MLPECTKNELDLFSATASHIIAGKGHWIDYLTLSKVSVKGQIAFLSSSDEKYLDFKTTLPLIV